VLKFKSASVFTKAAKPLVGMLLPQLKRLQIDIAFMFQGGGAAVDLSCVHAL